MAMFSQVPVESAKLSVLPPRRALQEQYRAYVRDLTPDVAGRLGLGGQDRPIIERARLKAAAKAEGKLLHIQRRGNTIVFWETDEPPKTRQNGRRKSRPGK